MRKKDLTDEGGAHQPKGTEYLVNAISYARIGLLDNAIQNVDNYFLAKNTLKSQDIYNKIKKIYRDEGLKVEIQEKMKLYIKTFEKESSRINPKGLEILIKELTEFKTLLELK